MRRLLCTAAAVLALAGCAESTAEVNSPEAWETKAADPAFARRAEAALRSAPAPQPGWRIGIVTAENKDGDALAAVTPDGVVYLTPAWSEDCDGRRGWGYDEFQLVVDVGDLFTWAGDGRTRHNVCADDFRILRKSVA